MQSGGLGSWIKALWGGVLGMVPSSASYRSDGFPSNNSCRLLVFVNETWIGSKTSPEFSVWHRMRLGPFPDTFFQV